MAITVFIRVAESALRATYLVPIKAQQTYN